MSRLPVSTLCGLLVMVALCPQPAQAEGRRVAVILDTSSSMLGSDPPRYAVQITKILADLVNDEDELTAVRIPRRSLLGMLAGGDFGDCSAPASSSLALALGGRDRSGFKARLDDMASYDTNNYFAAPIRTAIEALSLSPDHERMLLIVADSGGLGPCDAPLSRELSRLHDTGATVAAVNLGGAGAFEGNPAFDFTIGARNAEGLIAAVAGVYQRFLGSKRVQTGRVDGLIEVEIDPHVAEAYLVVAADGPLSPLEEAGGNPRAAEIDLDHRGGGTTRGLDGQTRGYRIVRLRAPEPGRWSFRATEVGRSAGWLLVQDSGVGIRLVSPAQAPRNVATVLEAELYDRITGQRIDEPCDLPGLDVRTEVEGREVRFRDDGSGGDREAGDCTFSATATFTEAGRQELVVELETADLDRTVRLEAEVIDLAWRIEPKSPERAEVGAPVQLEAELEPMVPGAEAIAPEEVVVSTAGTEVARLADDGSKTDAAAGDRVYSGTWTPPEPSEVTLEYTARGGAPTQQASKRLEVVGVLDLGELPEVRFEPLASGGEATASLDLSGARVEGSYEARLTSTWDASRSLLEVDTGEGWVALGGQPVRVELTKGGPRTWPLRLRVANCPEAVSGEERFEIAVEATGPGGAALRTVALLSAAVAPDPWLHCWWPVIALGLGLGVVGVVIHGFWSPSRFARRLGVVLSPEEDMSEGYPHSIRACRRTGAGFYRDATVYVRDDFRLAGTGRGAIARLRADGARVRIRPEPGASIWRKTADGDWERLPPEEAPARFGVIYRNDPPALYFELRNA
jgi:hypothetical protein